MKGCEDPGILRRLVPQGARERHLRRLWASLVSDTSVTLASYLNCNNPLLRGNALPGFENT